MKKVILIILSFLVLNFSLADEIDMDEVREAWVWWNNEMREDLGLKPYSISQSLNQTAVNWSKIALQRWDITHKRSLSDSYYDYKKITSWFANQWVEFKNISWKTYSESIGRGRYTCKPDCTQGLIEWIKSTHKFFISEKWKSYSPHYNAMVMPQFSMIWVWIVVDEKAKKYYLTAHYWTQVIGENISSKADFNSSSTRGKLPPQNLAMKKETSSVQETEKAEEIVFIESADKINLAENENIEKLDLWKPVLAETINIRTPDQIAKAKDKLTSLLKIRISN